MIHVPLLDEDSKNRDVVCIAESTKVILIVCAINIIDRASRFLVGLLLQADLYQSSPSSLLI